MVSRKIIAKAEKPRKLFSVVLVDLFCVSPLYLLSLYQILTSDCRHPGLLYLALKDTKQAGFIITDRSYKNIDAEFLNFYTFLSAPQSYYFCL